MAVTRQAEVRSDTSAAAGGAVRAAGSDSGRRRGAARRAAPGLVLIGILLIVGAFVIGVRTDHRRGRGVGDRPR